MAPSRQLLTNIQEDLSTNQAADSTIADAEATEADEDADKAITFEFLKLKRENLTQLIQNREERKKYAKHIFSFTCFWAAAIFLILILSGWNKAWSRFDISDKVLITLITSTTVNFFGFFLLVVKYLFHTDEKEKEEKKKNKAKKEKAEKESD